MNRFILNIMHFHLLFFIEKTTKPLQVAMQLFKLYFVTLQFWYWVLKYIDLSIYIHIGKVSIAWLGRYIKFKQFFLFPIAVYST